MGTYLGNGNCGLPGGESYWGGIWGETGRGFVGGLSACVFY